MSFIESTEEVFISINPEAYKATFRFLFLMQVDEQLLAQNSPLPGENNILFFS